MRTRTVLLVAAAFSGGFFFARVDPSPVQAASPKVYELRTYTTLPGRLDALKARFRNHTVKLFEKHGMKNIGYWTPADAPKSENTLVYILQHDSREAAAKSFAAFRADPAWIKARDESEKDAKIVEKVESVFMTPADFSALQ